jgi:hypothetical protein
VLGRQIPFSSLFLVFPVVKPDSPLSPLPLGNGTKAGQLRF